QIVESSREAREHAQRGRVGDVLQIRLIAASAAQNEESHVREHRVRLTAQLDRVLDSPGTHELDHSLDERASVDLRADHDHVEPLDEHGEPDQRHEKNGPHDGAATAEILDHIAHGAVSSAKVLADMVQWCPRGVAGGAAVESGVVRFGGAGLRPLPIALTSRCSESSRWRRYSSSR